MILPRLAAVAACLATAVACGGGDTSSQPTTAPPTTTSALTKEAFVAAVNATCKKALTEAQDVGDPSTAAEYVAGTEKYIGILEEGQRELRALEPPADAKAKYVEFVAANDEQIQLLRDLLPTIQAAAAKNDEAAVEAEFGAAFTEFNAIAEKQAPWANSYELTECT
ncbi:MAG TPA: hypothetical protein VNA20_03960 [Frankiaceae bacterium]|nr:hypothetical protein [Frankiaceae bacterium]